MKNLEMLVALVLVLLVVGALLFSKKTISPQIIPSPSPIVIPSISPSPPEVIVPTETTLSGESTCLPHKDTSGPQTMECAFGLKTEDGKYYTVDTTGLSEKDMNTFQTSQYISLTGNVTPIEALSTDHWQKYNVSGIISVKSVEKTK